MFKTNFLGTTQFRVDKNIWSGTALECLSWIWAWSAVQILHKQRTRTDPAKPLLVLKVRLTQICVKKAQPALYFGGVIFNVISVDVVIMRIPPGYNFFANGQIKFSLQNFRKLELFSFY